jgi:hypothetical protein
MKMDFTTYYRLLWKPGNVFKEFAGSVRPEPFILLAIVIFVGTIYQVAILDQFAHTSWWLFTGFVKHYLYNLVFPVLDALFIYLSVKYIFNSNIGFFALVSALIFCQIPFYIASLLFIFTGFSAKSIGLGVLMPQLADSHPMIYGIVEAITPVTFWYIILIWIALQQMSSLRRWQNGILAGGVVLMNILETLLWMLFAIMIFNKYNPVT